MRIQKLAYKPHLYESRATFAEKLALSPRTCWVSLYGDAQVAAYLFAFPWLQFQSVALDTLLVRLPDAPDCLYMHDMAIDQDYRGCGIGQALTHTALQCAVQHGFHRVMLTAVQRSMGYWARFGFKPTEGTDAALKTYGTEACLMLAAI